MLIISRFGSKEKMPQVFVMGAALCNSVLVTKHAAAPFLMVPNDTYTKSALATGIIRWRTTLAYDRYNAS